MLFEPALREARLLRRYQRFLADVEFPGGERLTVHCPNTGAMLGCDRPGSRVWLSRAANPARKYAWTWELVEAEAGVLVGIHTGRSNRLVREALTGELLPELRGYTKIQAEVRGGQGFRADFFLSGHPHKPDCWLEVKNVTAAVERGVALFPDAVSERASRHLQELLARVRDGHQAVLCYCVQRSDVRAVRPADAIDPVYGENLRRAMHGGVEVLALGARVSPQAITLNRRVMVSIE